MRKGSFNIKTYFLTTLMVIAFACIASACGSDAGNAPPDEPVGLANPASVYCEDQGGELEIRTAEDGGQYGVCMFDDGTECEEWAYFREECKPGMYEHWEPE
jgi:putative hemolysin